LERVVGFFGNFEVVVRYKGDNRRIKEFKVGAVVLTTGANLFDPGKLRVYGYGEVDEVLTALEFEEMNRSGRIALSDGSPPSSVAIVHCVGRELKGYCSEICCMYALKFSRYLTEKIPSVKVFHLYSDICVPGKVHQKFYEESLRGDSRLIRSSNISVEKRDRGATINYVDEKGSERALVVDMIILAPAMEPCSDSRRIAEIIGIPLDREGFFASQHEKLGPVASAKEGVLIAGCAQGPKGISDVLVQAQASAGSILASLVPGRKMEIEAQTSHILESFCQGCKVCIAVCPFGAITYDERRKVAITNEVICRGCGSCSAACPSGAAVIKHSTYDQIYQEIVEAVK
jgi:heterodisulfide reductase subunit A